MKPNQSPTCSPANAREVCSPSIVSAPRSTALPATYSQAKRLALIVLSCAIGVSSSVAQAIRFQSPQVRVTVPVNSTTTTTVTNSINLAGVSNAVFNISGLPAGAGAYLTDTNGAVITAVNGDTNLWLVVNTTNIPNGLHTFSVNASGFDTNGAPVTNNIFLILQAAHIWNGSAGIPGNSNAWSQAGSWLGGLPGTASDVVFGETDAQTNIFEGGFAFTNSFVDVDTTVASLRFAHTAVTNAIATNANARPRTHGLYINPGRTLTLTGTNGFSMMRDYVDDLQGLGVTDVNIFGGAGSRMVISNANANFAMVIGNSPNTDHPTLNASNLNHSTIYVSRIGLGEFQLFPFYRHYNDAHNYGSRPAQFCMNFHMPRTNIVTALYKDPDGYTNEFTRAYALTFINSETRGVGSGPSSFLNLGQSNAFFLDSVCFIRANQSSGNNGAVRFNPNFPNGSAIFRSTNGGRLSLFAVSDDGGTNFGAGNVKANVDFASNNGLLDVLADRLIIARDRTLVDSNHTVNVTGDLTVGRGVVDVNTAILGFQEAVSKTNWYAMDPNQADNAYLGFCVGNLVVTNGGTFRVNRTLTLGFTADTNDVAAAHQYETAGRLTVYSNSTVQVSNILVDTGLNFYDSNGRQNRIAVNQGGLLIVSNTIGGASGLPLDRLTLNEGTVVFHVNPNRTNAILRQLICGGAKPSVVKVASLVGVTSYPTNIPIMSYESAAPFLAADMSSIGGGIQGYIIDNPDNKTIDLFLTTNAPKNLVWRGSVDNVWNLTTKNWRQVGSSVDTNFSMGDIANFDDSSTVNNIDIATVVVPNQTAGTNGVMVTNNVRHYTFNAAGGAIAGTAQIVKTGNGILTFNAAESGPITVLAGQLDGSGILGTTVIASNATLNFSGTINNGLTSTGTVIFASGATMNGGALLVRGGYFENSGIINTVVGNGTAIVSGGAFLSNTVTGEINIDTGGNGNNWVLQNRSTLANFGLIKHLRGRLNLGPTGSPFDGGRLYGTGTIQDPDGGAVTGGPIDGRLAINQNAIFSPGLAPNNSIGTFSADCRIDLNNIPASGYGTLLIEVDFGNSQVNDIVECDRWNNITGMLLMTNINPGAGSFALGQSFQIFANNNGLSVSNFIDVNGSYPLMWPPIPAPGLQWGLGDFRRFGTLTVTNTALVWNGNSSGLWDTNTANTTWQGGLAYSDNAGAMFNDSAAGTTSITITQGVAPAGYATQTNIVPNVSTNITAFGPAMSPGIVISNTAKNYTFAGNGRISGITGLYKEGSGTLTILTTNDFSGNTYLMGGTTAITNVAGLGTGANNEVLMDGATLNYIGNINGTLPRAMIVYPNNAIINVASATNELTLAAIHGQGGFTKTGPGTVALNSTSDYGGTTTVNEGILRVNNGSDRVGTNTMILAGGSLQFSAGGFNFTNAISVTASSQIITTNTYVATGPLSGSGSLAISNSSTFSWSGSMTGYSGGITLGTNLGNFRFNHRTNENDCVGSATASFNLGTGFGSLSNFNGAGLTYHLGALSGGANTILAGRMSNSSIYAATSIYSIGANGQSTVFNGRIMNGADTVSVVKVGAGTLALNGVNTYTGSTTVSNGTLGGHGTLSGPLTVTAGGTLAPGTSAGRLTVNSTATLSGLTIMELDRVSGVTTNDQLAANAITAGGTLIVTNIGPTIFNGSVFKLFSVPVSGFTSVTLPAGYGWNNKLNVDGSIELTSGGVVATNPPTITSSTSGGGSTLTLNWPASHIGWTLQVQTNTLSVGISNNWSVVGGSSATNTATVGINPAAPTVFYRLVYP